MSRANVYDNWDRLVGAVLKRDLLRRLALCDSLSSSISDDIISLLSFDSSIEDAPAPGEEMAFTVCGRLTPHVITVNAGEEYGDSSEIDGYDVNYGNELLTLKLGNWLSSTVRSTCEESDQDEPTMLSETSSEESDQDEPTSTMCRQRPVVSYEGKKGLCHRCLRRNRFTEREVCVVCGAKYCRNCVLRAMGCMPEGRKCISCIGFQIDESKRVLLGKCSKLLKKLLTDDEVKLIVRSELSCEANQLPSQLIHVNNKPLSMDELLMLQNCPNPPKKIRPGKYWYDKVSGFWGKDGEKPSQIISAELEVGYQIREDASNGDTNVTINNRRITKAEFWMLKAAGIYCSGSLQHFWLMSDGSCMVEGMKNVMCKLWTGIRVKILCAVLSLPYPSDVPSFDGER